MIVNKYNTGGGGGGSYTLPTATASRLGGIKVGSGLTVENDGTLSVSGGTAPAGGGDYMVVSGLPQSAENGQLFFVPAHSSEVPATSYTFDCSQFQEVETFVNIGGEDVHCSGGDFYWNWENDNQWHSKSWGRYKADNGSWIFYADVFEGTEVTMNPDAQQPITVTTGETAVTVDYPDETYRYESAKSGFTKQATIVDFNRQDLFSFLQQYSVDYIKENMSFYRSDSRTPIYFDYYNGSDYYFLEGVSYAEPIGPPELCTRRGYYVNEGSTEPFDNMYKALPMRVFVNLTDSGVSSDSSLWVRTAYSATDFGGNPICVKVLDGDNNIVGWTQNCWFRQAYDGDNSDWVQISDGEPNVRIFGCEWYMYGDKITAEWALDGEGSVVGGAPLNWTVTSNVHSSADSTIPNNS